MNRHFTELASQAKPDFLNHIAEIVSDCRSTLAPAIFRKFEQTLDSLNGEIPYTLLGGKKIRRSPGLIRFKIGRDHRLICKQTDSDLVPYKLVTRQAFERELVRRR
jgi:hypothetical protein